MCAIYDDWILVFTSLYFVSSQFLTPPRGRLGLYPVGL